MAYRVTKWVKGKPYAYLQRSFREGASVRTVSEYLGPVDPAEAPQRGGNGGTAGSGRPARSKLPDRSGDGPAAVRLVPSEHIRISTKLDKTGLSERVARQQHATMLRTLARLGIPSDRVPVLFVRRGAGLAVKPRWRGGFVVTLPRFERVKGADVRAAYRLALGRAALEAIRTEKPETFARLSIVMQSSFRDTNAAVLSYARSGGHPDAWTWSLCLRFFGYANPLPGREAEALGLVGYGGRKAWDDETAALVGKIAATGWTAAMEEARRESRKAKAAETRAVTALRDARGIMGRIRRPELRRRIRAATAKRSAVGEMEIKLSALRFFVDSPRP